MKNMKIAVTADQPLDEIVRELESKGFAQQMKLLGEVEWVITNGYKYSLFDFEPSDTFTYRNLITLAELKEMQNG